MRILFIHTYYAERGGEDLVFETESKLLQKHGHEVETLSFSNQKNKWLKFILYPFNLLSFYRTASKIKSFKPDVVHFHNWHFAASISSIVACKVMRVPIVQTLHNYRLICPTGTLFHKRSIYLRSINHEHWNAPVHDKVYRDSSIQTFWVLTMATLFRDFRLYKWIKRYIVLTPSAKEIFMSTHFQNVGDRFVVKSNFLEDKSQGETGRKPYFIFVGRLTFDKGIKVLLAAFKELPFELKIVGGGPLKEEVEQSAANHPNITYLGFQGGDVINQLMREASAIIFPSVSFEGMPMTILEAYSNGCPVIASRFSAMETMVKDGVTGLHFKMGDVQDLKEKIQFFSKLSPADWLQLSQNAREEYELNYTPEVNLDKLEKIYEEAVA